MYFVYLCMYTGRAGSRERELTEDAVTNNIIVSFHSQSTQL